MLPDIIVLTEIWIYENDVDIYKIPGYKVYYHCNQSYRSGGVIVNIINSLSCSESNIDSETADIVHININLDKSSLCILAVYRLHCFTVQAFTQELEHILYRVKDKNF